MRFSFIFFKLEVFSVGKKENDKREKFTQKKKSKAPIIGAVIVLGIALLLGVQFMGSQESSTDIKATATVGQTVTYSASEKLQQVKVPLTKVENGKVTVASLTDLKEKKFIWTEYKENGKRIPLTALVKPNGKVIFAVSICEPCKGETFHIRGNQIVCNVCGTTWDLSTFKGISGGCQDYPPEILNYTQNGDNLEVEQSVLNAWRPRV